MDVPIPTVRTGPPAARLSGARRFTRQCSAFIHPVTSDRLRFTSDLPPDMKELIDEPLIQIDELHATRCFSRV
jgi:hypothetical protein